MSETHLSADLVHDVMLFLQLSGLVMEIFKLLSFDKVIGSDQPNRVFGCGPLIDGNKIDAFQCGNRFGALALTEYGPTLSFIYVLIRRDRHYQNITHFFCELKMFDVTGVHEIETTMTVDDFQSICSEFI